MLIDKEVHKGLVKYDLETDMVQLNEDNTIQAYSSKKVLYFEIFDKSVDSYRQFYALPYTVSPGYKTPILFEVLHEGTPLSLLARENITTETVNGLFTIQVMALQNRRDVTSIRGFGKMKLSVSHLTLNFISRIQALIQGKRACQKTKNH